MAIKSYFTRLLKGKEPFWRTYLIWILPANIPVFVMVLSIFFGVSGKCYRVDTVECGFILFWFECFGAYYLYSVAILYWPIEMLLLFRSRARTALQKIVRVASILFLTVVAAAVLLVYLYGSAIAKGGR